MRESVKDRLDDLGSAVADEDRLGGQVEHPAELGRDHAILRGVQFQQSAKLPGADHFPVEVHQEQLGGIRVGKEAGVNLEPSSGMSLARVHALGEWVPESLLSRLIRSSRASSRGFKAVPPGGQWRCRWSWSHCALTPRSNGLNFNPDGRGC